MRGYVYSIIAGLLIAIQGVMNTRVSEKLGMWCTVAIVHAVGFAAGLAVCYFARDGSLGRIGEVSKFYLLGGVFGVGIVYAVMKGIIVAGPTLSISIVLITQLLTTWAIDSFGWLGCAKMQVDYTKPLGVVIMIIGIIVFKIR
jgi:transporter family-2 protein